MKKFLNKITVAIILLSLISLTTQNMSALEMRKFQNEVLSGFQEFAENITGGKPRKSFFWFKFYNIGHDSNHFVSPAKIDEDSRSLDLNFDSLIKLEDENSDEGNNDF